MSDGEFDQEEEKKPFWKTPLGIILIVVGVILLCCCISTVIAFASGAAVFEELLNDPEIQSIFEEVQATLEAEQ